MGRRTSRLLRNARKSPSSGASTPTELAKTISSRSRSCVREYRQQPSRAFHMSHIFNTHNLESNNSKNTPNRPIDLSEIKKSSQTTLNPKITPNSSAPSSINSSANVQTKTTTPSQSQASSSNNSSTITKNTSQSSKKYIPDVRKKRVR